MAKPKQSLPPEEVGALAAGVIVVALAALITTQLRALPLGLDFALSLGLGAAAYLGARKVLDPRTTSDRLQDQLAADQRAVLSEMKIIAARIWAASQRASMSALTAQRLRNIATLTGSLVSRYRSSSGLAGAAATLTVLKQFDRVLAGYVQIRSGEQFIDNEARELEMAETEERTIPMVQAALQTLGQQLDAGRVVDKQVWESTLASLLRSLDLAERPGWLAAGPPDERNEQP